MGPAVPDMNDGLGGRVQRVQGSLKKGKGWNKGKGRNGDEEACNGRRAMGGGAKRGFVNFMQW